MKGLLLLSSGIDSPVAGYLMKKKGVELIALHFDNKPYTNDKPLEITKKLCNILDIKKLIIVNQGKNHTEFLKNCTMKYKCILCRRMMFKIAEEVAKQHDCEFLITGESLAQVASQTGQNLVTTRTGIKIPILTPVLGNDKQEIVNIAIKIGTYETSTEPTMCCMAVPPNPATKAHVNNILREEAKVEWQNLIETSVKESKTIDF